MQAKTSCYCCTILPWQITCRSVNRQDIKKKQRRGNVAAPKLPSSFFPPVDLAAWLFCIYFVFFYIATDGYPDIDNDTSVSHCFKLSHLILLYLHTTLSYLGVITIHILQTSKFDQKTSYCAHHFDSARPTSSTVRLELSGEGVREDVPFTERQIGPVSLLQLPDHTLQLALKPSCVWKNCCRFFFKKSKLFLWKIGFWRFLNLLNSTFAYIALE